MNLFKLIYKIIFFIPAKIVERVFKYKPEGRTEKEIEKRRKP